MKMEYDITKVVEEIAMQAKETQEEFIFETIRPYCENILQMKINKEELKQILLISMQKQRPCEDAISRAITKMEEASKKDKLCGGYPYQRCIDILKEVIETDNHLCRQTDVAKYADYLTEVKQK